MSHAPIRQLAPRIRGRLEVIVEIVDRAANVYDWEFPRRVGGTPEAAELSVPKCRRLLSIGTLCRSWEVSYTFKHLRQWTTTTISVSEDEQRRRTRFEILPVRWALNLENRGDRSYLVVRERFADVACGRLRIVRI